MCVLYDSPTISTDIGGGRAATPSQKCDFLFNITKDAEKERIDVWSFTQALILVLMVTKMF